jgi:hypothetical protein
LHALSEEVNITNQTVSQIIQSSPRRIEYCKSRVFFLFSYKYYYFFIWFLLFTVQSPTGRNAMVFNAPAQMHGQVSRNNGASYSVPVQTNRLPQQPHVAYIATKPVITKPMAQYPTKAKDKKMQLFSL